MEKSDRIITFLRTQKIDLLLSLVDIRHDPTEDDKMLLKVRVDDILSKCHKVSDIYQSIIRCLIPEKYNAPLIPPAQECPWCREALEEHFPKNAAYILLGKPKVFCNIAILNSSFH